MPAERFSLSGPQWRTPPRRHCPLKLSPRLLFWRQGGVSAGTVAVGRRSRCKAKFPDHRRGLGFGPDPPQGVWRYAVEAERRKEPPKFDLSGRSPPISFPSAGGTAPGYFAPETLGFRGGWPWGCGRWRTRKGRCGSGYTAGDKPIGGGENFVLITAAGRLAFGTQFWQRFR